MYNFKQAVEAFKKENEQEKIAQKRSKKSFKDKRIKPFQDATNAITFFMEMDLDFAEYLKDRLANNSHWKLDHLVHSKHNIPELGMRVDSHWELVLGMTSAKTIAIVVHAGARYDTSPTDLPNVVWSYFLPTLLKLQNWDNFLKILFAKYPPDKI